ncbi:phosphohistidine phosphatase SixA [Coxiella endosymbiont of Ornithodoros maritimus]|uniref:phosphohistidine phosphatase SixA n=1 Tax=Coxiella endosymbiont of Ornithodoros maritimus TaxID=1656172 RepID=UPI0022652F7E|nr:phosphohistidine phosphatase SixA [Coxiella endosymbiont of Ornithodoros maritimus]
MSMKLYCVRHGHAEQFTNQRERPLSAEGIEEINKEAAYLKRRGVYVVHIKHSKKLRARQSAGILASAVADEHALEECPLLGEDHLIAPLIDLIQEWHDDTMLVGHMPFMSRLVSALVLGDDSHDMVRFPPGTIVCLEQFENRWILNWVLRPDLVPDQGD